MRLLRSIYFINSASMPFAKVNLDGNIHITGKNGSGKTSILRAILFFYNPDTQSLGIGQNQKTFIDFYFPDSNSFVIYEIEKENFTYLVIAFKKQNRVSFRITECNFAKEDFIKDNQVNTIQEVLMNLHSKKKPVLQKTIDTYKEFKSLIYGSDNEFKRYSIFDSKGINYQNIPRTIANIFLNYKLDSQFIKHSIINSIMEEAPSIDLVKIRHQLSDFYHSYDNIKTFDKHNRTAKTITEIYINQLKLEAQKKEFARMLGYRINNAKLEKIHFVSVKKELEGKIKEISDNLDKVKKEFNEQETELVRQIKNLEEKIRDAENKRNYYQKINIERIIEIVESESSLDKDLKRLQSELDLLLSEHMDTKKKYELMKGGIQQSIKEKENEYNEKKNKLDHWLNKYKDEIRESYETRNKDLKQKYQKSFDERNSKKAIYLDSINKLNVTYKDVEYSTPQKDKINELQQKIEKYKQDISDNQFSISKIEGQIKLNNRELEYKTSDKNSRLKSFEEQQKTEIKKKETELSEIEEKLKIWEHSFSGFLEKNYDGHQDNISKVVSDEILFNTELEPEIKEKNNLLFGIKLNLSKIKPVRTNQSYSEQRVSLLQEISSMKQEFDKNFLDLKNKYDEEINSVNRKINELERNQAKIKKDNDNFNLLQEVIHSQLKKVKEESEKAKNDELNNINNKILTFKSDISILDQEITALTSELDKEAKLIEQEKLEKFNGLNEKYKVNLEKELKNFQDFKLINEHQLQQIEADFQKDLTSRGANQPRITQLKNEIEGINNKFETIKKSRQHYHNYQNDKIELIDKVSEFQDQIKNLGREKEWKSKEFYKVSNDIKQERDLKTTEYTSNNQLLNDLEKDLEYFDSFKNSSLFAEIAKYISEENYSLSNDKKISVLINDLNNTNNELTSKFNTLRDKITGFSSYFDDKNIFSFKINNHTDQDFRNFAINLKSFLEEEKLNESKDLLVKNYSLIVSTLSRQIDDLSSREGEIYSTIKKINNSFGNAKLIDVIKDIELRLKESNNKVINCLKKIREFSEQNPYTGEINLFNQTPDHENEIKAVDLLKRLKQGIEEAKSDKISLEESFEIEFRIKENNNDTGFIERLSSIGSNGTDVLVKAMIYITLLDIAKSRLKIKDFKIHCIVDEVGILDNNYLKYLIQFANEKDILLLNCSPNPTDAFLYEHIYRVRKDTRSKSIVIPLIETIINETTNQPGKDIIAIN